MKRRKRRLLIRAEAERDVTEHADYIARDSLDAAVRFIDAVDATIRRLLDAPHVGRRADFDAPELLDVRILAVSGFRSYLVLYRVTPDMLDIGRVVHGARDLPRALRSPGAEG